MPDIDPFYIKIAVAILLSNVATALFVAAWFMRPERGPEYVKEDDKF